MGARARTAWLKSIGTGDDPLPDQWMVERPDVLRHVRFPEQPGGIKRGDLLVYYASGKQRLFGIARSTLPGDECPMEMARGQDRWPYPLPVQVLALIPDLRLAPEYAILEKASGAISQKSHIRLTDVEYGRFFEAFLARAELVQA